MKQISVTRTVFTLDELAPDAKEKAINTLREEAWEYLDGDMVSEDLAGHFVAMATGEYLGCISKRELEKLHGIRIWWSVSYSQGDNAKIDGKLHRSDTPKLAWPDGVTYCRVIANNYYGSRVECIETDDEETFCRGELFDEVQEMVDHINTDLYRAAKLQCEAYTSEEYVVECYNDWIETERRFSEDGSVAPYEYWECA